LTRAAAAAKTGGLDTIAGMLESKLIALLTVPQESPEPTDEVGA